MTNPYLKQLNELGGEKSPPSSSSSSNPYLRKLGETQENKKPSFVNEQPDAVDELTTRLGNLNSYMKSIASASKDSGAGLSMDVIKSLWNNFATSTSDADHKMFGRMFSGAAKQNPEMFTPDQHDVINKFDTGQQKEASQPLDLNPISMAAGFGSSMIDQGEKIVGAMTNTVNDQGVARAATPMEQAQNLQSLAGTVAQIATFKDIKGALTVPRTAEEALALQRSSRIGKIARNAVGEGVAATAAGGAQGILNNLGNPAQQEQAVSQALTFLPIGMAFGILGGGRYADELDSAKERLVNRPNAAATQELASLNGMRVKANSTVDDLTKSIDFVNKSDNMVEAELKNKLGDNDGFVTYDLTPEAATSLTSRVEGTPKIERPNYQPIPELDERNATFKAANGSRLSVDFEHPLDKVGYLAAITKEGKRSKVLQKVIDDAKKQTGLTDQELKNFGKNVRDGIKQQQPVPRDQATIDQVNRETQSRGETAIHGTKEGDVLTTARGENFVREGDLIKGDNGIAYPINSQEAHLTVGREPGYEQAIGPNIKLPEQQFSTQYGDDLHTGINVYHSPANSSTIITKLALNDYGKAFFERSGYLPGEIVSHNGKDAFVIGGLDVNLSIKDPITGEVFDVPSNEVRRTTGTLQSITNSEGFTRIGKLSKETFLDNLFKDYLKEFRNTSESFDNFNQKFFTDKGIGTKDFEGVENYLYKRLSDATAQDVLSKDEIATRGRLKSNFDQLDENRTEALMDQLNYAAKSNNLVFTPEGAGKYTITTPDAGWKATVSNPAEVFETINKVKQLSGLALDGGGTNVINPSVANPSKGGFGQTFKLKERSPLEKWYDNSTSTGLLSYFAPVVRRFSSVDNSTGISNFQEPALKIQEAQLAKKATAQKPEFQDLTKLGKISQNIGKSIKEDKRWVVGDHIETASAEEIAKNSLARPLNSFEKKFAAEALRNIDVGTLRNEMLEARKLAKKPIGSPEFASAMKNTIKDPARLKAAQRLILSGQQLGPDLFSTTTVMDYADALNNPKQHLTKAEFARVNKMTDQELAYSKSLDDYYAKAASIAGIPKASILTRYLPRIRSNFLSGDTGGIPEGFARELEKFGITSTEMAERDPQELVRIYHSSLLNHISGFSDALSKANTQFQKQIGILKDNTEAAANNVVAFKQARQFESAKQEELKAAYYKNMARKMDDVSAKYISDSRGIPDMTDQTAKAADRYWSALGFKSPETNSVLQLFSLGHIALRPALAFRDVAQSLGNVYISFGQEMAEKAFRGSLSQEYMEAMQKKGVIPKMEAGQLIDPGSNGTGGFGGGFIQRLSESSYKLSGQELAYNRVLAGIYKATRQIGERELEKLRQGIITKEQAYERLGLHNHGPAIQTEFDKLVSAGKPDQATDFLGKWNGRYAANYFGMANSPSGWNTNFGRLLGQYGSWSANATHTLLEQAVRGNKKQIMGKIFRAGVVIGGAYAAEHATGLKIHNWAAGNPLTTFPGVGPVVGESKDLMDEWSRTGDPSAAVKMMGHDALGFIPYYQAVNDWKKSYDLLSQGDIRGIPQATGIQAVRNY